MKVIHPTLGLAAGIALLVGAGCSKQGAPATPNAESAKAVEAVMPAATPPAPPEPAAAPPAAQAPQPTPPSGAAAPVTTPPPTATDPLQAVAAAVTNRVATALGATNALTSIATTEIQALLEQAKTLTANQKYQEALATLTRLYDTQLTPAQKQQADALKAQIQTAMSQKASSALGNFLGGKK